MLESNRKTRAFETKITMDDIGGYRLNRCVGSGTFGGVWECVDPRTNTSYAAKVIDIDNILNQEMFKHFRNELTVHSRLNHPGITKLVDAFGDDQNVYIILELCDGGDMSEVVKDHGGLSEDDAKYYFKQIMEAVAYLHKAGVAHRDIKLDNILVTQDQTTKLTDFGLCRETPNNNLMETTCGTLYFASPEILLGEPYDGTKADIWSCGVTLYAMVANHFPWVGENEGDRETAQQIVDANIIFPADFSYDLKSLLSRMLDPDPNTRLTAEEVLESPWLADVEVESTGESTDPDPDLAERVEQLIRTLESKLN